MPKDTDVKDQCIMHSEKIHQLELNLVEVKGDVKHIRERIDNGLSATISKVWDKLNTMDINRATMEAIVKNNSLFLDKLKTALIWVSVTGVAGGVITLMWKLAHHYLTSPSA